MCPPDGRQQLPTRLVSAASVARHMPDYHVQVSFVMRAVRLHGYCGCVCARQELIEQRCQLQEQKRLLWAERRAIEAERSSILMEKRRVAECREAFCLAGVSV